MPPPVRVQEQVQEAAEEKGIRLEIKGPADVLVMDHAGGKGVTVHMPHEARTEEGEFTLHSSAGHLEIALTLLLFEPLLVML